MSADSAKGKARAADAFESADQLERAPLLPQDDAPLSSDSPAHRAKKSSRLRHGRGPLVPDSDDEGGNASTPLNNDSEDSGTRYVVLAPPSSPGHGRRWTWGSVLCTLTGVLLILFLFIMAALHLWVGHLLQEQASHGTADEMAQRGLLWEGPSAVRVQALPSDGGDGGPGGVLVELDGMAGVDVRKALDWEDREGEKSGWRRRWEGRMARWGVRKAGEVAVSIGEIALYDASSSSFGDDHSEPLLVIPSLDTLRLPLSYPSLANPLPTLRSFTLHVPVTFPTPDALLRFGKDVWARKEYRVRAEVRSVAVKVGDGRARGVGGWMIKRIGGINVANLKRVQEGLRTSFFASLPPIPPLTLSSPAVPDLPPSPADPMALLANLTYSAFPSPAPEPSPPNSTVIAFSASGILSNPLLPAIKEGRLPPFAWGLPFRLPITVSLPVPPVAGNISARAHGGKGKKEKHPSIPEPVPAPAEVLLARLSALPFSFPLGANTADLAVSGFVVPDVGKNTSVPSRTDDEEKAPLSIALSNFVKRFLNGLPNTISLRYDVSPPPSLPSSPNPEAPFPPPFLSSLLGDETFSFIIPGSNSTPDFFQNLRMEDMRVKLGSGEAGSGDLLASGKVVGEVVLPEEVQGLGKEINAKWIWPDVLVYDGDLPAQHFSSSLAEDESTDNLLAAGIDQLSFRASSSSLSLDDQPAAYPPTPVPANAFARMSPSSSMVATTLHVPGNSTHPVGRTFVSAAFVDAPLFLLPGRGDILRKFIAKIVFAPSGGKVKASMRGITGVKVDIGGLGEVELEEVPIEAGFMVGRGGVESLN